MWQDITTDHLNTYKVIYDAFEKWAKLYSDEPVIRESGLLISLVKLGFEDLAPQRTQFIIENIRRGIVDEDSVRASLHGFSEVHSPLLEGTL